MNPSPGEVFVIDLGIAGKVRPAVVLSRYDPSRPIAPVILAAITTQNRGSAYEVSIGKPPFLREKSWINVQSLQAIDPREFIRKLGTITADQLAETREALRYIFEL